MLLSGLNRSRMVAFKLGVLSILVGFFGAECNAASTNFFLARRTDPRGSLLRSATVPLDFDRFKPTYVLVHGLGGSHSDGCMRNIQSALLQRADVNVIAVDYARIAFGYVAIYREIARQVSTFLLRNGINPTTTTVMGQSLGAQISGALNQFNFKPSSIIGMDPAGPQFNSMPSYYKLSRTSADTVQAVHTNVGGLGSTTLDGTIDVYINRGYDFPCCSTSVCRHIGACHWFADTIRNGPTSSVATTCTSQSQATRGICQGPTVVVGFDSPSSWFTGSGVVAHVSLNQCVTQGV